MEIELIQLAQVINGPQSVQEHVAVSVTPQPCDGGHRSTSADHPRPAVPRRPTDLHRLNENDYHNGVHLHLSASTRRTGVPKAMRTRSVARTAALSLAMAAAALLATACSAATATSHNGGTASIAAIGAENEYANVIQQI